MARSKSPVLVRHWDFLLVPTRILIALRSGVIDMGETVKEHRPILEALERRDAALAGQLVYDHVNRIALRLKGTARDKSSFRDHDEEDA